MDVFDGARIGLLGGSFNPAHDGHLEISQLALHKLKLDAVWWLVSPQNPLKSADGMAALTDRVKQAGQMAAPEPRIMVTDIEKDLDTRYTADTLAALKMRFSEARFVWLMGADNLLQMHRWRQWSKIFHTVPVAVFARPSYSLRAEGAKAARRFARYRMPAFRAGRLADKGPPAWAFLKHPHNPQSATAIRRKERSVT